MYRLSTMAIFPDLLRAFDSIDRTALSSALHQNSIPGKFVDLLRALYWDTCSYTTIIFPNRANSLLLNLLFLSIWCVYQTNRFTYNWSNNCWIDSFWLTFNWITGGIQRWSRVNFAFIGPTFHNRGRSNSWNWMESMSLPHFNLQFVEFVSHLLILVNI